MNKQHKILCIIQFDENIIISIIANRRNEV